MMCDPVCEHRFRSCHTVYFILSMDNIGYWTTPSFVTLCQLSVAGTLLVPDFRRTSVRPPHDIEKSVAHRLHCAMPLSGNFAIQAAPIIVKLLSSAPFFSTRALRHLISREYGKQRERWQLSNENPSRHGSSVDAGGGVTK